MLYWSLVWVCLGFCCVGVLFVRGWLFKVLVFLLFVIGFGFAFVDLVLCAVWWVGGLLCLWVCLELFCVCICCLCLVLVAAFWVVGCCLLSVLVAYCVVFIWVCWCLFLVVPVKLPV